MYLLEGTAPLQHRYHLKMGDVMVFAQKDDREKTIVLAGRPATRADAARKAAQRRPSPTPAGSSGKGGGKGSKDVSPPRATGPRARVRGMTRAPALAACTRTCPSVPVAQQHRSSPFPP
jgi:hypothetical protein